MIKRDEITGEYIGVHCDVCSKPSPPVDKVMAGHGLNNMGWYCRGGNHFCPDHAKDVKR